MSLNQFLSFMCMMLWGQCLTVCGTSFHTANICARLLFPVYQVLLAAALQQNFFGKVWRKGVNCGEGQKRKMRVRDKRRNMVRTWLCCSQAGTPGLNKSFMPLIKIHETEPPIRGIIMHCVSAHRNTILALGDPISSSLLEEKSWKWVIILEIK